MPIRPAASPSAELPGSCDAITARADFARAHSIERRRGVDLGADSLTTRRR